MYNYYYYYLNREINIDFIKGGLVSVLYMIGNYLSYTLNAVCQTPRPHMSIQCLY